MRVVFGECEFDSGQRMLLRHGSPVPLSLKAFELLAILLDRRPEVVAKEELLQRLWPETFVSDAGLHNLVAEIRSALGDAPRAARFIRTVPRYGYAFHGDARPVSAVATARPSGPRLLSSRGEWLLSDGANVVGRESGCAVRIDSVTVSRRHAQVIVAAGEVVIEELGSKNGTQVNGKPVTGRVALKDGDQIEVGSVTLTFRMLETSPPTVTHRM